MTALPCRGLIPLSTIVSIERGHATQVFKRNKGKSRRTRYVLAVWMAV
jgi:hypothetical protein